MLMLDLKSKPVNEILYVSFNQDFTCFIAGTENGFRVYNTDPYRLVHTREFGQTGGLGVVAMLYRTNILAFSGGGHDPKFEPKKIVLWDDRQSRIMAEIKFQSPVKSVRLRRDLVVTVLINKVCVHGFRNLRLLDSIETTDNPKGLCCLGCGNDKVVLVCPGIQQGSVLVISYPASFDDPHSSSAVAPITRDRTQIIYAHKACIAAMAIDYNGKLLATASDKGTIIRVYDSEGTRLQELRRGADRAEIHSLAFGPAGDRPAQWLAVSSDKGTIHIFAVYRPGINSDLPFQGNHSVVSTELSPGSNSKSSLNRLSGVLPAYFSSEWSLAQFRVDDVRCIAGFGSEENTVVVVCARGSYHKVRFDPHRGGGMIREEFKQFAGESSAGPDRAAEASAPAASSVGTVDVAAASVGTTRGRPVSEPNAVEGDIFTSASAAASAAAPAAAASGTAMAASSVAASFRGTDAETTSLAESRRSETTEAANETDAEAGSQILEPGGWAGAVASLAEGDEASYAGAGLS
mmetsp:Transcript_100170/g.283638  ORF Transcript_100170/g.283638 Transcript_100170/m.283638 type:complete len:519 (-) Transcript_100170:181-1737(-)